MHVYGMRQPSRCKALPPLCTKCYRKFIRALRTASLWTDFLSSDGHD